MEEFDCQEQTEKQLEKVLSIHRDCQVEKLSKNSKAKRETCQRAGLLDRAVVGQKWVSIQKKGKSTFENVKNINMHLIKI